jgi:hypothetical protein
MAPFVAWATAASFPLGAVALASVFTVQDATGAIPRLRAAIHRAPAPAPDLLRWSSSTRATHLFTGTFPVTNFQQGSPPYADTGGGFLLDATGTPLPQRIETVRFALTLPRGPAPSAGFPLLLYAHGTGGSYLSCSREGLADPLAERGIATLTMDQVLHGPRNPDCAEGASTYESCVSLSYFNFLNPYAGRDNGRQGAADLFQLALLARALLVPPGLHPEGIAAGLDPSRLAFLGHSQGGLTGAPFAAAEPDLSAAAFSGTGGLLTTTILQRKDPLDFRELAAGLVGLSSPEELDPFHPALALLQTFGEPADPINYARHLQREPLGGGARNLLLVEGLLDPYTVADSSEAFAAAAGLDLAGAVAHRSAAFLLRGLSALPLPLSGNVPLPGGSRTGALLQFPNQGHFAIFDDPVASCRLLGFLSSSLSGSGFVPSCE